MGKRKAFVTTSFWVFGGMHAVVGTAVGASESIRQYLWVRHWVKHGRGGPYGKSWGKRLC